MFDKRRFFAILLLLFFCVGCDQTTKHLASANLKFSQPLYFLNGTIKLLYAENTGSWGGLGSQLPDSARFVVLTLFPIAILAAVAFYVITNKTIDKLQILSFSLILAGGIGNMIDRIKQGYVVDFMYIGYGAIGTNIFNVADVAIMAGMVGLLVDNFAERKGKKAAKTGA